LGIVRFALKFPYTFYVLAALIVFLGVSAIKVMPEDIFPEINIPVVSIIWQYTGLTSPEMEQRVSTYSQYAISANVNGIKNIEAQTLNGLNVQKIYFQPDVSIELILGILASRFKARATLEAENLVLRQQVNVLRRRTPKRPHLNNTDRFLFVWLYRWFPSVLEVVAIVRPETIIRWHRAGFRAYWRWRSRNRVGRPKVSAELRTLIGEMSRANALWGAPRIHGELLKLGFEIAQSTVARYMCRHSRPPSQGWRTFLSNHADGIAAIDLFVLPTIAFQILYCLVIVRHGRRLWVSFGVTANPTAEWISRQVTEAFPWDRAPRYLMRDRDTSYGPVFLQRIRAMGIRDHPIAPRSPWQNAYVERLIGSIRRECLDHMIVFGEAHLRRILRGYAAYYNVSRTHRSLNKDAPLHRAIERLGAVVSRPVLGGLHHQYCRI